MDKTLEDEFYFVAKMAGIEQKSPKKFVFDGKTYTAHARANSATSAAFGGKNRAFKLLRHADLIEHFGSVPEGAHIRGVVAESFEAISERYPILRSYYENFRIGGQHHTWIR